VGSFSRQRKSIQPEKANNPDLLHEEYCFYSFLQNTLASSGNPATDKVNHLKPIPRLQHRPSPNRTRNDLAIMLDRHPVAL
jgi:hypothetical protein